MFHFRTASFASIARDKASRFAQAFLLAAVGFLMPQAQAAIQASDSPSAVVAEPKSLSDVLPTPPARLKKSNYTFSDILFNTDIKIAQATTRHLVCETDFLSGMNNGIFYSRTGGATRDTNAPRKINGMTAAQWGCDGSPNIFTQRSSSSSCRGSAILIHGAGSNPTITDCRVPSVRACGVFGYRYVAGANDNAHRCMPCLASQRVDSTGTMCEDTGTFRSLVCEADDLRPAGQATTGVTLNVFGTPGVVDKTNKTLNGMTYQQWGCNTGDVRPFTQFDSTCRDLDAIRVLDAGATPRVMDCRVPNAAVCTSFGYRFVMGSVGSPTSHRCEACPTGMVPDSAGTACETPPSIASCNAKGQRFDGSSCVSCGSNEILSSNNCQACSGGQSPNPSKTACTSTRHLVCEVDAFTGMNNSIEGQLGGGATSAAGPPATINGMTAAQWGCDGSPNVFTMASQSSTCSTGRFFDEGFIGIVGSGNNPMVEDCRVPSAAACAVFGYRYVAGANVAAHRCEQCPTGQVVNSANTCQSCPTNQGIDSRTNTCRACNSLNGEVLTNGVCVATQARCHALTPPQRFDTATQTCQACPNNQVLVGNTCRSCSASNGEVLENGRCVATQARCHALTPPQRFDVATQTCQACLNNQGLEGNTCRTCDVANGEVSQNGRCAITADGCHAAGRTFDSNTNTCGTFCAPPTGIDTTNNTCRTCNIANGELSENGVCVVSETGCHNGGRLYIPADNMCGASCTSPMGVDRSNNTCRNCVAANGEVLENGICAITVDGCNALTPPQRLDYRTNTCQQCPNGEGLDGNNCRSCIATNGEVLTNNRCVATQSRCNALTPPQRFDTTTQTCQPCHNNEVLVGNTCRLCNAANGEALENGRCVITQARCNALNPPQQFDTATQTCRACNIDSGEVYENGICVVAQARCYALTPPQRFDMATQTCQACPNNQGLDGNTCRACVAANGEELEYGRCVITQTGCNTNNQILENGSCRSCSGDAPVRNGNVCQPSQQVCNDKNQVLENGSCKICYGDMPVRDGNNCQPSQQICNNKNQVLDNGRCVTCSGDTPVRNGNTCESTQQICINKNQVLRDGVCVACSGNTPIRNGNVCEPSQQICNNSGLILENGQCRPCEANQERSGNSCQTTLSSCNANGQVYRGGICQSCGANQYRSGNTCVNQPETDNEVVVNVGRGIAAAGAIAAGYHIIFNTFGYGLPLPLQQTVSPIASYSYDNGIVHYRIGARHQWSIENFSAYSQVTRSHGSHNSILYFTSGMAYQGDFWRASLDNYEQGKSIGSEFLLSANTEWGIWSLSPYYRVKYEGDDTSESWSHNLNFGGVWQGSNWQIRPSIGLHGSSFSGLRDNQNARLEVQYDF